MRTRLLANHRRSYRYLPEGRRRLPAFGMLTVGVTAAALFTALPKAAAVDLTVDQANNNSPFSVTSSVSFGLVRVGSGTVGLVNHTAGTLTTTGELQVAIRATSQGIYNLSGTGQISTGGEALIGYLGDALFNHSAGNFTTNGQRLYLGTFEGSDSTYNLSGTGQLTVAAQVSIGHLGKGSFNQSGGTFDVPAQTLTIGFHTASNSSYHLSDGSLTTGRTTVSLGTNTSVFTQSGGTHTTDQVVFGGGSDSAKGTYKLNGGTLRTISVTRAGGTGTFQFNGGLLQARQSNGIEFFQGLSAATVQSGGARIDTNGFDVLVGQALVHDPTSGAPAIDGGLTKLGAGTLRLLSANTYTGGTTVAGGILTVGNNTSLGAANGRVTVLDGAQLVLLGTSFSTARPFHLGTGALVPATGGSITYNSGASVNGGTLGAGNHILANGSGLNGARGISGTVLNQNGGTVAFNNVFLTGNATFTQAAGATLNSTGDFTANPLTTLTVNGTFNTTGGTINGALSINSGGVLNQSGSTTPLYLDGSRGVSVNSGGTLAAFSGSSIELGGLLINNGTQSGTLNINLGAIVQGSGTFGTVHVTAAGTFNATGTINGGLVVDNGASVILSGTGLLTVNGGITNNGVMRFERGAQLAVDNSSMFVNNGTLDIITGGFSIPAGFVNNGIVLDSSVVKIKDIAVQPGGPVTVSIDGYPGHTYRLERSDSVENGSFVPVPDVATQMNPASNTAAVLLAFTDLSPAAGKGFYRVAVDP